VSLDHSAVNNCAAETTYLAGGTAKGGGIFARGTVSLANGSLVANNKASGGAVSGGGIFANKGLIATNSQIYSNDAYATQGANYVFGGGAFVNSGQVSVKYSTISRNVAGVLGTGNIGFGGGLALGLPSSVTIANSTIYLNTANIGGGISSFRAMTITNSTIANNRSITKDAGIHMEINQLSLNSSIVSNNTSGADASTAVEDDVALRYGGTWSSLGSDNLVMASNVAPPANVVRSTADPQLGTLGLHGGSVQVMLPKPGSPVLNAGNNSLGLSFEQRDGHYYPRTSGGLTDIGAVQFDNLFGDGFE